MEGLSPRAATTDFRGRRVLSLPAANTLAFLEHAFTCWREGRLFAITRAAGALDGLGLQVETPDIAVPDDSGGGWGRFDHQPRLSDEPAQITFSSGTEGRPKAILLSHRNLADVVLRLNQAMGVTEEIREYIGVPVTYSFGLGRARAVAAAGGACFLPDRFDPIQIREMLTAGQINAISAVPSLWRLLLVSPDVIGSAGGAVRWIEIGSQYMSAADKLAMRTLFPNARILQHYGLTEASRTTFLDISACPDTALESVGEASGSVSLKITDDGAIAIKGDHVALGRLTEGGVLQPLSDAAGWLVTRDRGEIRDGRLYYLGRLDDQINLAGVKIAAEGLEATIRRLVPAAGETFATAAIPDPARGEAVLLVIEAAGDETAPLIEAAARLALTRQGIMLGQGANSALKVMRIEALPRTGTNKIQRRLLPGIWDAQGSDTDNDDHAEDGGATIPGTDLDADQARLAAIWSRVVGKTRFTPETSFYDAGGDSLSSVQIGLVMESAGLPRPVVRATMEGRSLREAAALLADDGQESRQPSPAIRALPDPARRSWAISMTRAIMALSVLMSHWGPGVFNRLGLAERAESILALIYRMGTPGFAAVFGIGIGYFMLPDFANRRDSVLRRLDGSFRLVLLGLVLLAVVKLLNVVLAGQPISGLRVAHAFYGVLGYYVLMLGTARLWLPHLARLTDPLPWLLAGLPLLWLVWKAMPALLPAEQLDSILEWPRLMLVAGYNIFKMTAVALPGMAAGFWLARQPDSRIAARTMVVAGVLGITIALLTLIEAHGRDVFLRRASPVFTSMPGLILYLSVAVAGVGAFLGLLLSWERLGPAGRWPLQLLVVIGGLALPIYVFHGLVIPLRDLLANLGLHGAIALILPMAGFLLIMAYAGRRLWRMYFG